MSPLAGEGIEATLMSLGKRLTGWVLAALGGIGIVACLAGVAGVWVTGTRLQEVNSQVFRQAEEFVVRLDRPQRKPAMRLTGRVILPTS